MAGTRKSTVQQVTVHLTSEEVEFLKTQAGIDGVSVNDVLRRRRAGSTAAAAASAARST